MINSALDDDDQLTLTKYTTLIILQFIIEGATLGIVSCSLDQLLLHFDERDGPETVKSNYKTAA